jgi:hypothetical protein
MGLIYVTSGCRSIENKVECVMRCLKIFVNLIFLDFIEIEQQQSNQIYLFVFVHAGTFYYYWLVVVVTDTRMCYA